MPAPRSSGGGPGAGGPAASPAPDPIAPTSNIYELLKASEALKARDSGVTTIVPIPREGLVHGAAADEVAAVAADARARLARAMEAIALASGGEMVTA